MFTSDHADEVIRMCVIGLNGLSVVAVVFGGRPVDNIFYIYLANFRISRGVSLKR